MTAPVTTEPTPTAPTTPAPASPAPTPTPAASTPSTAAPQKAAHSWAQLDTPDPFQSPKASDSPDPELKALFGDTPEVTTETTDGQPTDQQAAPAGTETSVSEPEVEPEVEPIPFRYTSDGSERTFEGVHEVPGEGLIVDEEAVGRVKDVFQRHDHLARVNQTLTANEQRFQAAGGWERFGKMAEQEAILNAVGTRMVQLLTDTTVNEHGFPAQLAELATNPAARNLLLKELDVMTRDASLNARAKFGEMRSAAPKPSGDALTSSLQREFQNIQKVLPDLTNDDIAEAMQIYGGMVESFVRPATAQEAAQLQIAPGTPIIDTSKTHPWFQSKAQQRQREARAAQVAADTAKENAKRTPSGATPTRPANTRAATPRPGQGNAPPAVPVPAPKGGNWKRNMLMGKSPFPAAPGSANP